MEVERLADGLWRWTVPPPVDPSPCPADVPAASVYLETPEAVVLFDPAAPPAGTADGDRFWRALDRDVERLGLPVLVLLTHPRHVRSTAEVVRRYASTLGATVGAPGPPAAATVPEALDVRWFRTAVPLPGGILGRPTATGGAALYEVPGQRAAVAGDAAPGDATRWHGVRILMAHGAPVRTARGDGGRPGERP